MIAFYLDIMIALERLKELLFYDPRIGKWFWLKNGCRKIFPGMLAGGYNKDGYWRIKIDGKGYLAHRLAWFYMTGKWPTAEIDHIDLVKDNNVWTNLREATSRQNSYNRQITRRNSIGAKGVRLVKKTGRYTARIGVNMKQKSLGTFDTIEEASEAYENAARKYFGVYYKSR